MSVQPGPGATITAEAFLAWSERQAAADRYELLDGTIVAMSAERLIHTPRSLP